MSIALKGIDLPKTGERIYAEIRPSGEVEYVAVTYDKDCTRSAKVEKTNAIQIPKDHGRIIDEREAIRGWCKECAFNDGTCGKDETICEDKEMCKYAPTILEAEE